MLITLTGHHPAAIFTSSIPSSLKLPINMPLVDTPFFRQKLLKRIQGMNFCRLSRMECGISTHEVHIFNFKLPIIFMIK